VLSTGYMLRYFKFYKTAIIIIIIAKCTIIRTLIPVSQKYFTVSFGQNGYLLRLLSAHDSFSFLDIECYQLPK